MGAILEAWAPSNPTDECGHQARALLCKGTAVGALFQFVLTAATSNDGAHGHGAAVGAVGAMFHVRKCAQCTVVGARATGATLTARLDNMNSRVHQVDMKIWTPRTRTPSHDTAASPSCLGVSPP
jgi:hypothetical protein